MDSKVNRRARNSEGVFIQDLHFTKCKGCGSKNLFKVDVDTFCAECDWNSILMDVDCGNFEKRIALMNRKRHQRQVQIQDAREELIQEIVV